METKLTLHARKRMKERLGVKSLKKAEILAEKAWISGTAIEQDRFLLEEHVSGAGWDEKEFSVKIFRNAIFVFSPDARLITVMRKPLVHYHSAPKTHLPSRDGTGLLDNAVFHISFQRPRDARKNGFYEKTKEASL